MDIPHARTIDPLSRTLKRMKMRQTLGDLGRKLGGLLRTDQSGAYVAEASLDLDVLAAHDEASKHLVKIDMSRLERRNKDRGAASHHAVGEVHVEVGSLRWTPHRLERSCGVPIVQFTREQLRLIERKPGAVIAVLRDGTNVPFVVADRMSSSRSRGFLRSRSGLRSRSRSASTGQEPPLIS